MYYTASTIGVQLPQAIQKVLTTMQISQFVIGAVFAAMHLFISYGTPVSTPYNLISTVTAAASAIASVATDAAASASSAVVSGGVAGVLKKLAYRAAGEEGLAENVRNKEGQVFGPGAGRLIETLRSETRYRTEYQNVHCIDTSGQAFAIYLNLIYLLPLT